MNIMQANPKIGSMDAVLDKLYGKVGSPEREEFRKEAYSYCVGQIISDARKQEKMTQNCAIFYFLQKILPFVLENI